jgi:hypothetical protein
MQPWEEAGRMRSSTTSVAVVSAASAEARLALITDEPVPEILQATFQPLPVLVHYVSHDRSPMTATQAMA